MRILQVVTLLDPDGAYGGPARVALNQSAELIDRGHEVTVAAGTRGYRVPPNRVDGVPVRLFTARTLVPGTGFAGVGAPGLQRWFHHNRTGFDVVHIHLGRDLVVLPVAVCARRHEIPYAVQTHGMIIPSRHPLAGPLDAVWTRKVLLAAGAVFHLTPLEKDQLDAVTRTRSVPARPRFVELGNGVPIYPPRPSNTPPRSNTKPPEVLFVARIHARKRPTAFVETARALLSSGVDARFTLIGPDGGDGRALRTALAAAPDARISWEGALDPADVPRRMAEASVYVLPAVREPYPMSVLEAMSVGLPVVVTRDCGLAPLIERTGSGIVADPAVPALVEAVATLLTNDSLARAMGENGRRTVQVHQGMPAVADRLLDTYDNLVGTR
ncbi:glycosyltransferase [Rhodococcus sp. NPDC003382]|uniref:glycosyltransferase n=3 Tax=unclassified Rhodococcus (in: high G+C Gram-positive bacteria) TaxID=192944 RepID=UPI0018CC7C11|nr:glycosyltransferase [Rhodococcus sp. CX]MBH0121117.1 glycosyltransferase [Rhodococcus sp. CX]